MMLTLDDITGPYREHPDLDDTIRDNIRTRLLPACWALEQLALADGIEFKTNPHTRTTVSGAGNGGFRPKDCPCGATFSNHKRGLAVDRYDPDGKIDAWCLAHLEHLVAAGIWIEAPAATEHWSHWQCVAPKSGNRVFMP